MWPTRSQAEAAELAATLADLADLLARPERVTELLVSEALELKTRFGQPRRTAILSDAAVTEQQEKHAEALVVRSLKPSLPS